MKNKYPINSFKGETQKELIEFIEKEKEAERKKIIEEIENVRWADISKEQALEKLKNKINEKNTY